ncbi:MAG: hypothetical protein OHK0012_26870 [Synechococcales cyanobacterium]
MGYLAALPHNWPRAYGDVYVHLDCYTRLNTMRTSSVIDDKLLAEAMQMTDAATKREAVELGLKALIRH